VFDSIVETPIIFITGAGDQEIAVQAMKAGAYDYLIKDPERKYLEFLPITVQNAIKHSEAERQLRLLQSAVINANDAILITEAGLYDMPGPKVVYVNDAFTRMTQFEPKEVIGKTPRMLQGPKTQREVLDRIKGKIKKGDPCREELINYKKDGSEYWVDLNIVPLRDDKGNLTHYLSIHRDITEKKLSELKLVEARKKEVQIAASIQDRLLVERIPTEFSNLQISSLTIPSEYVDGDFYEFIKSGRNCLDLVIGDVMGKGIQAALVGAATKSHIHRALNNLIMSCENIRIPQPQEIINFVNSEIASQFIGIESFVTLCYTRIDMTNCRLSVVDCGHTKTIHFHKNTETCSLIEGENLPLGFIENEKYEQNTYKFEKDDLLLFYSDGITETINEEGKMYGVERLIEQVLDHKSEPAEKLIELILKNVKQYSNSESFQDDLTCIAIRL
jgi:PAS domain S-box-containing protein